MSTVRRLAAPFAALLWIACGASSDDPANEGRELAPPRGIVLISIDALRADALGLYGSARPTSPFLDSLAQRSLVFDNAFCQIPSTLPSHLSMFTGLYPSEHGVFPPSDVLSSKIATLPELFRTAGYRTIGHSEGGYVQGGYGFARGFDEWTDTAYSTDADIERTFGRGVASLERLAEGERFFVFLHTYSVHDPYEPPAGYAEPFWPGAPPAAAFAATGPNFAAFNRRKLDAPAASAAYYRALYDAGVRYLDDTVASFFAALERLGVAGDTIVVFTSDHGEEFLDHGRFVHTQVYPESLRIPLLVFDPRHVGGGRVARLVETVDFLPTLAELAGFEPPSGLSGESFADLWRGGDPRLAGRAYAQDKMLEVDVRSLVIPVSGRPHQLISSRAVAERDGFWAARELVFDAYSPRLEFRAVAFHQPRRVAILVGGEPLAELVIGTQWASYSVLLPAGGKSTVTLRAAACDSPIDLGLGSDPRCLSFKIDGPPIARLELYDLAADPGARRDLSGDRPDLVRALVHELRRYPEVPRAASRATELTEEQVRQLKALGYLQ